MDWSDDYFQRLTSYISPFQVRITGMHGKRKMSQNKSASDRERVAQALRERRGPDDLAVATLVAQDLP